MCFCCCAVLTFQRPTPWPSFTRGFTHTHTHLYTSVGTKLRNVPLAFRWLGERIKKVDWENWAFMARGNALRQWGSSSTVRKHACLFICVRLTNCIRCTDRKWHWNASLCLTWDPLTSYELAWHQYASVCRCLCAFRYVHTREKRGNDCRRRHHPS